jgi:enoyl-[acyl-carrier protein] reductase II
MAWVATAELSAAVSEAGGLGVLGGGNAPPEYVRSEIRRTREMTSKPFGVNIAVFSPFLREIVQICIDEKVPVVMLGAGNPSQIVRTLLDGGVKVIPVISSAAFAIRLERIGVTAVVAEGEESGGHVGEVSTFPLVPQVVDAVKVPVIAAGGIADGRGLVAALSLGAVGIQMGTRFICTTECRVHENYKQRLVAAGARSTIVTGHSVGHPVRAIRNKMTTRFAEMERARASEEEILAFGTGTLKKAAIEGDMINGSVMAGQVAGMIDDIVPVKELIERIVREADEALARLCSLSQPEIVRQGALR